MQYENKEIRATAELMKRQVEIASSNKIEMQAKLELAS